MSVPTVWSRLSNLVLVLLFCAGVLAVGIWYLPLIRQNETLQAERLQLEQQLEAERARGADLAAQIHALTNNPAAAERAIRERLGLARPGETVVHFEAAPASNSPGPR